MKRLESSEAFSKGEVAEMDEISKLLGSEPSKKKLIVALLSETHGWRHTLMLGVRLFRLNYAFRTEQAG